MKSIKPYIVHTDTSPYDPTGDANVMSQCY